MFLFNGVVSEKEKFNLMLPAQLMREVEKVSARYGKKRKWMSLAAGMALLLELPEGVQHEYIQAVGAADLDGDFAELIDAAKNGTLRREVSEKAAKPANLITLEVEGGVVGIPTEEPPPESRASQTPRRKGEWHRHKRQRRPRPGTPNSP